MPRAAMARPPTKRAPAAAGAPRTARRCSLLTKKRAASGAKKATTMATPPRRGMALPWTLRELRPWSRRPERSAASRTTGVRVAPTSVAETKATAAVRNCFSLLVYADPQHTRRHGHVHEMVAESAPGEVGEKRTQGPGPVWAIVGPVEGLPGPIAERDRCGEEAAARLHLGVGRATSDRTGTDWRRPQLPPVTGGAFLDLPEAQTARATAVSNRAAFWRNANDCSAVRLASSEAACE